MSRSSNFCDIVGFVRERFRVRACEFEFDHTVYYSASALFCTELDLLRGTTSSTTARYLDTGIYLRFYL